jgi:uncharacterized protein
VIGSARRRAVVAGHPQVGDAVVEPPTAGTCSLAHPNAEPQPVVLRPDRTAWLQALQCLLVADVHLGKAARLRHLGVPVPEGGGDETLQRLSAAIDSTGARRVVVLGDLLQGPGCITAPVDAAWRAFRLRHPTVDVELVRGNHDRRAGDPPQHWDVRCGPGNEVGGWSLVHEPPAAPGRASTGEASGERGAGGWIAGHVHPGVVLRGRGGDSLRLPCFHVQPQGVVLPAFGAFTGLHIVSLQAGERAWAVGPSGLVLCAEPSRARPIASVH